MCETLFCSFFFIKVFLSFYFTHLFLFLPLCVCIFLSSQCIKVPDRIHSTHNLLYTIFHLRFLSTRDIWGYMVGGWVKKMKKMNVVSKSQRHAYITTCTKDERKRNVNKIRGKKSINSFINISQFFPKHFSQRDFLSTLLLAYDIFLKMYAFIAATDVAVAVLPTRFYFSLRLHFFSWFHFARFTHFSCNIFAYICFCLLFTRSSFQTHVQFNPIQSKPMYRWSLYGSNIYKHCSNKAYSNYDDVSKWIDECKS